MRHLHYRLRADHPEKPHPFFALFLQLPAFLPDSNPVRGCAKVQRCRIRWLGRGASTAALFGLATALALPAQELTDAATPTALLAPKHLADEDSERFDLPKDKIPIHSPGNVNNTFWPFLVDEAGFRESRRFIGPLVEDATRAPDPFAGDLWFALRPIWLHSHNFKKTHRTDHLLYPLLQRQQRPGLVRYSAVLNALTYVHRDATEVRPANTYLRAFPFVYYRDSGDPEADYFGVLPFGGSVKDFLFYDELTWTLFPLYGRTERNGLRRHYAPFPFVQWQRGNGAGGWALWPLLGNLHQRTPRGLSDFRYLLWPLVYRRSEYAPSGRETRRVEGILPFYAHERSPNLRDVTFVYPFFGWRRELDPAYREERYLWPLWVQGRGRKTVNRWLPFHAHTTFDDGDQNRWFLFPLLNLRDETRGEIRLQREQLLYFLFRAETRTLAGQPPEAFTAKRYDLWPLLTAVDNGAGLRQLQFPSILAPIFPGDRQVQRLYTPLLTLYRYESTDQGARQRHSLLWGLFTRTKDELNTTNRLWFLLAWSASKDRQGGWFKVLGGALTMSTDADGQRTLDLFHQRLPQNSPWRNVGQPRFGPRR